MCCSMTCWDCMIMQDSDIIVSSRPDFEKCRQVKASNYVASEARLRRNDNKLTTILPIITKNDKGL